MATYDLGKVVGDAGEKGDDGSTVWNTSTAPTYANSKYTFNISNLSGKTGLEIAVNDIIFYSTYYYIVSAVNTTTVDCSTRVSIKGSDASVTIQTSWGSTTSDSKVPSEKLTKDSLDNKASSTHTHGNLTNDGKVGSTANYFVYTTTSGAITSKQKIGNITTSGAIGSTSGLPIITTTSGVLTTGSFGTGSGTFAEGNHTHSGYISTSSTTGLVKNDGTIMTSGTGSTNYAAGNHTHSGYVSTSDIADNLTTNDSTKVLSAKQGKVLNDLIGAAIAYINQ